VAGEEPREIGQPEFFQRLNEKKKPAGARKRKRAAEKGQVDRTKDRPGKVQEEDPWGSQKRGGTMGPMALENEGGRSGEQEKETARET